MSWTRALKGLIRSMIRAEMGSVRTWGPGQIVEYDAAANKAKIQLCVRRIRTEDPAAGPTVDLPVIEDVPVYQMGSGVLWGTVPPAVGSYGAVFFSDRDIEAWLVNGGIVDPGQIRKWDLSDAVFYPGLLPFVVDGDNGQIEAGIPTDRIGWRTRSGQTEVSVLADESAIIKVGGDKAQITVDKDGNVSIVCKGDVTAEADGAVSITGASVSVSGPLDVNGNFTVDE
jgi:hypothetical protein